jgi:hypothetical protein
VTRTWPLRGLTDTKEGRLAIIIVVGGLLVVGLRLADVVATRRADAAADDVRQALRTELRPLPDDDLTEFAADSEPVAAATERALRDQPARLLALGTGEDEDTPSSIVPVVLVIETGWAWQARCIRAELQGHGTVLTEVRRSHC